MPMAPMGVFVPCTMQTAVSLFLFPSLFFFFSSLRAASEGGAEDIEGGRKRGGGEGVEPEVVAPFGRFT